MSGKSGCVVRSDAHSVALRRADGAEWVEESAAGSGIPWEANGSGVIWRIRRFREGVKL